MEKSKILEKYKTEEERLLVSKLFDKIALTEKNNKIQATDFLSHMELRVLKDVLNTINYKNYVIYGGVDNAQRNIVIVYPEKLETVFQENRFDYNSVCNCVRITENVEQYDHKVYLGGIIKLGVKREKIGDIITYNNGADIIVSNDITKFLMSNLSNLTRFKKSNIEIISLSEVVSKEQEYKEFKIIVSSLRLDNIVAELARTSRNKSLEIIKQERVFINYKNEVKHTKLIECGNIVTVRGVGKFIIDKLEGNTRSGKFVVLVKQYV